MSLLNFKISNAVSPAYYIERNIILFAQSTLTLKSVVHSLYSKQRMILI